MIGSVGFVLTVTSGPAGQERNGAESLNSHPKMTVFLC